jgi:S-adenosylmethionine/arginine decarboxylase-like enzyme
MVQNARNRWLAKEISVVCYNLDSRNIYDDKRLTTLLNKAKKASWIIFD